MIGYSYNPKPLTGERAKQLADKSLKSNDAPAQKITVKMPDKFTVKWK